ncbi:MAG: glutaminyl-peptide cyclotransferase [Odoribacter sp.]
MIYYIYYIICLGVMCSCAGANNKNKEKVTTETTVNTSEKDEIKYINSIKLTSPEKNKLYSYNEDISIHFESKDRFPIDSAIIYINGQKIAGSEKNVETFVYRLPEGKTGNTAIKVIAYHPENKRGIATTIIRLKPDKAPILYNYDVIKTYPHDPKAYTQGLIYRDGFIYEGTGQYGESSIRKSDIQTGKILSILNIDNQLFGEGITIYKDKIYQITWRSRKGFIYDLKTFTLESTFQYNSEGWGITTAGDELLMSDGSNKLYHITPTTFNITQEIEVYDNNGEVNQLNELEYVDGLIWANVWLTNRIVAIDPTTGAVKAELDLSNLLSPADKAQTDDKDDVLNGIAWNPEKKTFYLTGKRWPKMFEIKIKE